MSIRLLVSAHRGKFILSLVVSLGFIYAAFKDLEWQSFWDTISSVNYWYLILAALVLLASNIIRAARWKILLSPQKNISRRSLFDATMIGYFGNNILPFKLGEVLRTIVVSKQNNMKISGVGASVFVERSIDMLSFVILAGLYGLLIPKLETARLLSALGLGAIVIIIVFTGWMSRHHDHFFHRLQNWTDRKRDQGKIRLADQTMSLFKGLETIWRMPKPFHVTFQTLFLWLIYLVITALGLQAFNLDFTLSELWNAACILLIFTTLSIAIPAAPGYVGTYHGAVIAALLLFNVDQNQARAFAVVFHLLNYLIYTPVGGALLIKTGLKLDSVTEIEKIREPAELS